MKEIFSNKWTYLFIGIILGGIVQYISSVIANENLKKELIAELTPLLEKKKTTGGRMTGDDENRIIELQAQLNLLNK